MLAYYRIASYLCHVLLLFSLAIKVIFLVCGSLSLPNEDEEIIHRTIYDTIKKTDKGFIGWLKDGRMLVDTDILVQLLNPALVMSFGMPRSAQGETNIPLHSFDQLRHLEQPPERKPGYGLENENLQQQLESFPVAIPTYSTKQNPLIGKLVLKSKLRYGKISFGSADLKVLSPKFWEIPEDIVERLLQTNKHFDEREVKIMLVPSRNEQVVYVGDQDIEMADNDLILLKTRVNKGLVSIHEDDVEVRYPADWQVPDGILQNLKRTASNGKLLIISDEKGNLRCTVKSSVKLKDRVVGVRDMVLAWIWPF